MLKLTKLYDFVIYESTIKPMILSEIDWEGDFKDVKQSCINPTEIVDYLNRVRANAPKKTKDREKFGAKYPFIHAKSTFFKDKEEGGIDVEHFVQKITTPPETIINTNKKIMKSGGPNEYVYKTGIPALRGIVYDISKDKFHYINTCPGAGSCALICYALKGNFIRYPDAYDSMTRRLNFMLNYPDRYEEQLYTELKEKCDEHKALKGYKAEVILRWNDSGDFFGKRYTNMADDVLDRLQSEGYNVRSYAYTKSADVTKDAKFDTVFSQGANKKETGKMAGRKHKNAAIVPKELFKDLELDKYEDEKILKERVSEFFGVPKGQLITYDELMRTPVSDEKKWYVLVTPNDGDDAAFRRDVKNIFLTFH